MALTLNGTTGLSGIVGSAGTPALQGGDTNTGYFFGTDTLGLSTGGTQRLQIDSSGNIKLGSGATQTLAVKTYGYSGSYKNIMIGNPGSNVGSVGICVDVSTISGSNFNAQHQAVLGKNGLLMPNEAGDNFIGVLGRDASANKLYIGPGITSGLTTGPLTLETSFVGIGTTAPQRNLHIHEPSDASAYLHLTNNTTGSATTDGFSLYVATDGQTYYRARENTSTHRFYTGTTEKLHIDYSGRLGIGVTPKTWHSNNKAVIQGLGGYAILARSNNLLGIFQNFYYDANDAGKYIEDGEATGYFQNDGNHIFYTAAAGTGDASASFSEVLKVQADKNVKITDGDLVIGTADHGINFSAQTASAATGATTGDETLNHYEEGTWTPTTGNWSVSESTSGIGRYTRIGNFVQLSWNQGLTVTDGGYTGSGSGAYIGGLPFSIADCAVATFSNSTLWTSTLGSMDNIGTAIYFRPNAFSNNGIATDSMFNASGVVKITLHYRTT